MARALPVHTGMVTDSPGEVLTGTSGATASATGSTGLGWWWCGRGGGAGWSSAAIQSWNAGMPLLRVALSTSLVIDAEGRNQPEAPSVSATLPRSVPVGASQFGRSTPVMPLHVLGSGLPVQKLKLPSKPRSDTGSGVSPGPYAWTWTFSASTSPSAKPKVPAAGDESKVMIVVDG